MEGVPNDALDAGAHIDEFGELLDGIALPAILPFVKNQDDVVELEALAFHVEEPHAHCTGPKHEPDELQGD